MRRFIERIHHFSRSLALALTLFALAAPAFAADAWRVVEASGTARLHNGDGEWSPVAIGTIVSPGGSVETGANGRVVLRSEKDEATLSPSSRMEVPRQGETQSNIVQKLGTLLFKIERSPARRFAVDTPYLAAVVKGTTFTVTVGQESGIVHVTEGAVLVASLSSRESALVTPGQTAQVLAAGGRLQVIERGRAVPVPPPADKKDSGTKDGNDKHGAKEAAPTETRQAAVGQGLPSSIVLGTSGEGGPLFSANSDRMTQVASLGEAGGSVGAGQGKGQVLVITSTLGASSIDISQATGGLMAGLPADPPVPSTNGNGNSGGNGNGGSNGNAVNGSAGGEGNANGGSGTGGGTSTGSGSGSGNGNSGGNGNAGNSSNGNGSGNSGNGNSNGNAGNGNGNANGQGNSGNSGNSNGNGGGLIAGLTSALGGDNGSSGNGNGNANGHGNSGNNGSANAGSGNSGNGNGGGNVVTALTSVLGSSSGNSGNGNSNGNSGGGNSGNGNGNGGGNGNGNGKAANTSVVAPAGPAPAPAAPAGPAPAVSAPASTPLVSAIASLASAASTGSVPTVVAPPVAASAPVVAAPPVAVAAPVIAPIAATVIAPVVAPAAPVVAAVPAIVSPVVVPPVVAPVINPGNGNGNAFGLFKGKKK